MTRFVRLGALAVIAIALAGVGLASPAYASTSANITVNPGQSIQAAIDAANPGDTITVNSGVYKENLLVTKNDLTIVSHGATLVVPGRYKKNICGGGAHPAGFCVVGDPGTGTPVSGVHIIGFTVQSFENGVLGFLTQNTLVQGNLLEDSEEYGAAMFVSSGTHYIDNVSTGGGEAGFYIGDSPKADAVVEGNESYGAEFGQFVRHAKHVYLAHNYWHDNCVGLIVLADAPGPAGDVVAQNNDVDHNTRICPASEDGPPLSGIGIAVVGGHDVTITTNVITRNTPGGSTAFQGGVVIVSGLGGTPPMDNVVRKNTIHGNDPDIYYDGTGTGNKFGANSCSTSTPSGLCSVPAA